MLGGALGNGNQFPLMFLVARLAPATTLALRLGWRQRLGVRMLGAGRLRGIAWVLLQPQLDSQPVIFCAERRILMSCAIRNVPISVH
jgi:hypothetical protein